MDILVATNHLKSIGGTETYSYAIIEELKSRGLNVEYFTFHKGLVSEKIERDLKVSFMKKRNYDLILANHYTTVDRLFGKGFIIQTCHGIFPPLERPNWKANAFVSISNEVKMYLEERKYKSKLIYNGINLKRFKIKKELNRVIQSVLSLSQSDNVNKKVSEACKILNINFNHIHKFESGVWNIENEINNTDLVIGIGRSAYDAFSCGRPVVIFDEKDYSKSFGDGYAKDIFEKSLENNCSGRAFKLGFEVNDLIEEIKKYNSNDSEYFRETAEKYFDIKNSCTEYLSYFEFLKSKISFDYYGKRIIYLFFYRPVFNNFNKSFYRKIKQIIRTLKKKI